MERQSFDPTPSLLRALCRLSRASENVFERQCVEAATRHVLSPSKVRLLRLLDRTGPHGLGELARFLGVSEPAASQLVESLVRQRLIERRPDDGDRRCVKIALKPAGTRAIRAIDRQRRRRVEQAIGRVDLSQRQWTRFCNIVQQLALALDGDNGFDAAYCFECDARTARSCDVIDCPRNGPVKGRAAARSDRKQRTTQTLQSKRRK